MKAMRYSTILVPTIITALAAACGPPPGAYHHDTDGSTNDTTTADGNDDTTSNDAPPSDTPPSDGPGCTAPRLMCGSVCTDISSDPANCGSCGHACAGGQNCNGGSCQSTCSPPNM